MRSRLFLGWLFLLLTSIAAMAADAPAPAKPWAKSPQGPMLERIIPPGFEPAMLPEPDSEGARLTLRYCVQCHNLANPAMHDAGRWRVVVARMLPRMEGKGNLGKVMSEMMAGVQAPSAPEVATLTAYLRKHAQKSIDPSRIPEVNAPAAAPFRRACAQCHELPDPLRHTAKEWPAVVARMQKNMEWMNRVVGSKPVPGEPQLRVEDINAFLAKYARK
jgi:mono/diheme cytochrome c family protein